MTPVFASVREEFCWSLEPIVFKTAAKSQNLCVQILNQALITEITDSGIYSKDRVITKGGTNFF